jgi:NAD dependent epimerase/dehydratase family enzyme
MKKLLIGLMVVAQLFQPVCAEGLTVVELQKTQEQTLRGMIRISRSAAEDRRKGNDEVALQAEPVMELMVAVLVQMDDAIIELGGKPLTEEQVNSILKDEIKKFDKEHFGVLM